MHECLVSICGKMAPKTDADQERLPWRSSASAHLGALGSNLYTRACLVSICDKMAPRTGADQEVALAIRWLLSQPSQASGFEAYPTPRFDTIGEASRRSSPSSGLQPPHLSCTADWDRSQLIPAAGTIAQTMESCTKHSHCNRFDACMALWVALASAEATAPVPEWAVALELAQHSMSPGSRSMR